jgi:flagellar protein FliJ
MRRFDYRLEKILRFRKTLTQSQRVHLARKIGVLSLAEQKAVELRGIRNATLVNRLRSLEEGVMARDIGNIHQHVMRIEEAIGVADEDIEHAQVEVDESRTQLVERRRDEKAIELHRARRWQTWLRDYYRDENRTLDDLATIREARKKSE